MHVPVLSCEINNFTHEYKLVRLYYISLGIAKKLKKSTVITGLKLLLEVK